MNNAHFYYVGFLIIFAVGIFLATSFDFQDEGDCKITPTGDIGVRKPGSQSYVTSQFCIIIRQ